MFTRLGTKPELVAPPISAMNLKRPLPGDKVSATYAPAALPRPCIPIKTRSIEVVALSGASCIDFSIKLDNRLSTVFSFGIFTCFANSFPVAAPLRPATAGITGAEVEIRLFKV